VPNHLIIFPLSLPSGYLRLLSGDMLSHRLTKLASTKQSSLFPESIQDKSWERTEVQKKYFMNFPFYPFRTLNTRDLSILSSAISSTSMKQMEFDYSSPLFPAHTQLNIVFQKRKNPNFLANMLPYQLDPSLGSSKKKLNNEQKKQATTFAVESIDSTNNRVTTTKYVITKVEINVYDVYLQVS
jgi:hypothetical protein